MNRIIEDKVSDRLQLWIDGVGGYLVLPGDRIVIGQAMRSAGVDLPILGDLRRRHALIRRREGEYLLEPLAETRLNGKLIEVSMPLAHQDKIQLGESVEMLFRKPHPLSSSATLRLISRQRTEPASDGILLLADSLIMGPRPANHVICPRWDEDVVLYREPGGLAVRSKTTLQSGATDEQVRRLTLGQPVYGDEEVSFCVESWSDRA
ncbi:MAG: FHA domain-containing protein [Pirellulaceae bacterium]